MDKSQLMGRCDDKSNKKWAVIKVRGWGLKAAPGASAEVRYLRYGGIDYCNLPVDAVSAD